MDYKEKMELMKWHSQYSNLNGTDAKVLMLMTYEANYKTSEVIISLENIAESINASKVAVIKSIAKLIEQEAMIIVEKNSGKRPSNYRISNLERLNYLFRSEKSNLKNKEWLDERDRLFFKVIDLEPELEIAIEECKECQCGDYKDNICPNHRIEKREMEENFLFRKYKLWLMDNPKPNHSIITIKGKPV